MSTERLRADDGRRRLLMLGATFALVSCGGGSGGSPASAAAPPATPTTPPPAPTPAPAPAPAPSPTPTARSAKRGVAYDVATMADLQALSPGVSWWYD